MKYTGEWKNLTTGEIVNGDLAARTRQTGSVRGEWVWREIPKTIRV